MVVVSYSGKEINGKLVYYGPGLSGKTTNLEYIYQSVPSSNRGKMVSMKTRTERTLFFDFLPVDLGEMGGFKTRFLLYTVPGQVYYNATRKLVLRGVDAVIFVADSERGKMDENIESLQNLRDNLSEYGLDLDKTPWVIQYNKRDLEDVYSIEELEQTLNPTGVPYFEAVATTGPGVFETFRGIAKLLLQKLSKEIKLGESKSTESRTAPAAAPAPAPEPAPPGGQPVAQRPPSREMPYRPRRGDTPAPAPAPGPVRAQTPPPAPEPAPPVEEPVASAAPEPAPPMEEPVASAAPEAAPPVEEPAASEPMAADPFGSGPVPKPMAADPFGSEPEPKPMAMDERPTPSPEPVESFETEPAVETESGMDEMSSEPVHATLPSEPEPVVGSLAGDETFDDVEAAPEQDEPVVEEPVAEEPAVEEPVAEEKPEPAPVRKLEPVLPEARNRSAGEDEEKGGFWGRLFNRSRKDHRSEYRTPQQRQARVAEVKIPAVAGSGETTPVFIEKRIQVPVTLGPEEIVRGATLRLVLEIQVEASRDTDDSEEHRAA